MNDARAHDPLDSHILVYCEGVAVLSAVVASCPPDVPVVQVTDPTELRRHVASTPPQVLVFVLPGSDSPDSQSLADLMPSLEQIPTVLVAWNHDISLPALRAILPHRPVALVPAPFEVEGFRTIVRQVLAGTTTDEGRALDQPLIESNRQLNERLQEINAIYTVGKQVTASLDARVVLDRVVLAAVNLTQADEGFIVMQEGDELYLRVTKTMESGYPEQLREVTRDRLARQVIRSGRPAMLHREERLSTGLLVRALLYVPIEVPGTGTIGALGVVNRVREGAFTENQLFALSTIADFAGIALGNAKLFSERETERSRLSAILQQAAEVIIVTDLENHLWQWSDAAAHLFGFDDESRGRMLDDCVENEGVRSLFSQVRRDADVVQGEIVLGDGRVLNAQLSTIETVGHVAVMQDITDFKELDRLKSEFVSSVSHSLRTPLTTIQGYMELLNRVGPLNEMQQGFVGQALRSLNHITALISDLLDIGQIEAGYDLEMERTRLDEVAHQAVEAAQEQAASAGLQLEIGVPGDPVWVWGNEVRLRQVMDNLISNALKYNRPQGWVKVTVRRENDHAVVLVSDSGIAISPQEESRIFDRFYRVRSPETEDIQGTGLGLAIVKSVIEKHKGRVWVESEAGTGSTFTVVLPAHSVDT